MYDVDWFDLFYPLPGSQMIYPLSKFSFYHIGPQRVGDELISQGSF